MHIIDGIGDVKGLVRERHSHAQGRRQDGASARAPASRPYTVYDRDIASRAQIWLHEEAPKWRDRPWVLFVSFVAPHFPLTAPPHWFYRYWQQDLPMPKLYATDERPHHPFIDDVRAHGRLRSALRVGGRRQARDRRLQRPRVVDGRERRRRAARALRDAGLEDDTRVIYTSDHGDNAGARGLWGKSTFYEESAGVPLIVAGPGRSGGTRGRRTPVSHIDCAPTILEAAGEPRARRRPSRCPARRCSRWPSGAQPARPVISEYHAIGSVAGAFMLRFGTYKYCHYVAYPPQLFDLEADPEELVDLARRSAVRRASLPKASGCCGTRSIRKRSTRARSGARRSCSRASAAAKRRSRAAIWASRPRRAPPPR